MTVASNFPGGGLAGSFPNPAVRLVARGNKVGMIGDSNAQHGNLSDGSTNSGPFYAANGYWGNITDESVLMWAHLLSQGQIRYGGSWGTTGTKVADWIVTNGQADLAITAGCNAVVILGGTNDAYVTSVASFITDYTTLCNKLEANGVVPVPCLLPPRGDKSGNTTSQLQLNEWLTRFCASRGLPLVDIYTPLVADTGGAYATGMGRAAEGATTLHLSNLGAKLAGEAVATTMTSVLPRSLPFILSTQPTTDTYVLLSNALFQTSSGSPVVPTNWNVSGTGVSTSLGVNTTVGKGNVFTVTRGSADAVMGLNAFINTVAGHKILVACRLKSSVEDVTGQINGPKVMTRDFSTILFCLNSWAVDVPQGCLLMTEFTMPAATPNGIAFNFEATTASGAKITMAQVSVVDLTAAGVDF